MIKTRFTYKQMAEYLGISEPVIRILMATGDYDIIPAYHNVATFLLSKNNHKLLRDTLEWRLSCCRNCDKIKYSIALNKLGELNWLE